MQRLTYIKSRFVEERGAFVQDCNEAKYFFGKESNLKAVNIKEDFLGTRKGDLLGDFIDSIINDTPYYINAEKVFEVMSSSAKIKKILRLLMQYQTYFGLEKG